MTGEDLRKSILQQAIQGKLVPQDPNDEPASVLIQRIREEKEKLIKEKKIKKEKNPSYIFRGSDNLHYEKLGDAEAVCIEEQIPFEIPNTWEWVRLISVCTKLVDGDHNPPKGELEKTQFIMASSTNINNDTLVELEKVRYLSEDVFRKENERTRASAGDILFTSVGSLGRSCIFDGSVNICFQRSVSVLSTMLFNQYLKYFFDSGYFQQKIVKEATGTAQKGFYLNQLAVSLIPVPPLAEQQRIVAKIEQILPHIREYELSESRIIQLNADFPEQLKKSILQEAVQGKLVPQDPSDEPASALLERIRKEKARLVKEGKIKKDKNESVIFRRDNSYYEKSNGIERCIDEELPFEIPDSWEWRRLCCCVDVRDGTHDSPKYVQEGIPLITSKNLHDGYLDMKNAKFISQEDHEKISQRSRVDNNDILFAMIGSIGNPVLYNGEDNRFSIKNMALFKHIHNGMLMKYVYWWLFFSQYAMKTDSSGGVQSFVSLNYLRNYFIPVPPLAEQQRIVTKIEQLLAMIKSF